VRERPATKGENDNDSERKSKMEEGGARERVRGERVRK